MATNKNQHYVPRSYLRNFASDDESKSINIYNIDRDKLIPNAPLKNQCSKDYFYGKDDKLEPFLQSYESRFPIVVRKIKEPNYNLTEEDSNFLRSFWLLQYLRTDGANKRLMEITIAMDEVIENSGEFRLKIQDAVQVSMRLHPQVYSSIADLKCCIVRNNSSTPFITSDDPAILTNRWHLSGGRGARSSFGLTNAGAIIILPISPKLLFIGYDGDVHSVTHKNNWININSDSDADSFNQHQYLNCCANIFIQSTDNFKKLRESYINIAQKRKPTRYNINYAIFDRTEKDGAKRYRVVKHEQGIKHQNAMIHSYPIFATPNRWPSMLRLNPRGYAYSDGSAMGYVRRAKAIIEASPRACYALLSTRVGSARW